LFAFELAGYDKIHTRMVAIALSLQG